jgi:nudix-type nucleoside diphosphatase (YffH/AdpP family)
MSETTDDHPVLLDRAVIHDGWSTFSVARFRLPGGAVVNREVEDHGRAVCVLPYDPERRVAVLVRQFRPAVFVEAGQVSLVEAPAGLLDEDNPEEGARREALEEVGISLGALEFVVSGWSMPGISTERMDFYLAPFRAADRTHDGGGLAEEHEAITILEVPLAELDRQLAAGEVNDVKTLVLVQALRLRHPALFG